MPTWTTIENARMTAGGLWLPELSINLLGNDYAAVKTDFDMTIPAFVHSAATTSWDTVHTFEIVYPAIAHDDTYDSLTLRVVFWVNHVSDDGNRGYTMRFYDSTNSVASSSIANALASQVSAYSRAQLSFASTAGAWPTGAATIQLQVAFATTTPASDMSGYRDFGTSTGSGPDCSIYVVQT